MRNQGLSYAYTPCESYRGHVIALHQGAYYAMRAARRASPGMDTRAAVRRHIDRRLECEQ